MAVQTIHKFTLEVSDSFSIKSRIIKQWLYVAVQYGSPCLWVVVDLGSEVREYRLGIRGTGHVFKGSEGAYLGSFMLADGDFVGHVFRETSTEED